MSKKIEFRDLITSIEIRSDNVSEEGIFTGYASAFNAVDSYKTTFQKGCFKKTLAARKGKIKVLWNHKIDEMPIGSIISIEEDSFGLRVTAKLALDTQKGAEAWALLKTNAINTMSFGFTTVSDSGFDSSGVRNITEVTLYEVSLVNFESCPLAEIKELRSTDFEETVSENEFNRRGYALCDAFDSTRCEILWDCESDNAEKLSLMSKAFDDFKLNYMNWMQQAFDSGIRSYRNELSKAVNNFIGDKSSLHFAAETPLTVNQVTELRKGNLIDGLNLSIFDEEVAAAVDIENKKAKESVINSFRNLSEDDQTFVANEIGIKNIPQEVEVEDKEVVLEERSLKQESSFEEQLIKALINKQI